MSAPGPGRLHAFLRTPWFSLLVALAVGVAWLVVESASLGSSDSLEQKIVSALLSGMIGGLATLLVQLYGHLSTTVARFDRLDSTIRDVGAGLTELRALEERLLPSQYISDGMRILHSELLRWRSHIDGLNGSRATPLERHAWQALADAYFRGESERIQSKTFKTTSDQFTTLVNEVTQTLSETFSGNGTQTAVPLMRVHVTGMLPEEFYNGPQIEYTRTGSKPLFFCHRWEDYPVLYGNEYRGDPNTQIRRYVVVRQPDFGRVSLSALSTLPDLQEHSGLVIAGSAHRLLSNDLHREEHAVLARLLRKAPRITRDPPVAGPGSVHETIQAIHGFDTYGYWPIAEATAIDAAGARRTWKPLLEFFARDYHGDSLDDARYCALDDEGWDACQRDEQLRTCFEAGWTPEVALFGTRHGGAVPYWHFGILGLWRPFTRDMQLRFLTGAEAAHLHGAVVRMYQSCGTHGTLQSLTGPGAP